MSSHRAFAACCVLALAGCPVVDLGDTPPGIGKCTPKKGLAFFESDVWPTYLAPTDQNKSCVKSSSCHGNGHAPSFDPMATDLTGNYHVALTEVNCGNPMASRLLTRPLAGVDGHGGGDIFQTVDDPAVKVFLDWFK